MTSPSEDILTRRTLGGVPEAVRARSRSRSASPGAGGVGYHRRCRTKSTIMAREAFAGPSVKGGRHARAFSR